MRDTTDILLITGPAGIGKSTLCYEMSVQLAMAEVAHAVIETDELDRVHPRPTREELERLRPGTTDVSALNLAAIWSTYRALGHTRLIMSGVMLRPEADCKWIRAAIPDAEIVVVRLSAAEDTLLARLAQREVGSDGEGQVRRTLWQAKRMAGEDKAGLLVVETDGKRPSDLARAVLLRLGWLS